MADGMMEIRLCHESELSEGAMLNFEVDGRTVLLCRVEGQVYALDGICPHRGAQLATGTLTGTVVTCPWHEWTFDCADGCGITNPQANLDHYTVTSRDGALFVELPELS